MRCIFLYAYLCSCLHLFLISLFTKISCPRCSSRHITNVFFIIHTNKRLFSMFTIHLICHLYNYKFSVSHVTVFCVVKTNTLLITYQYFFICILLKIPVLAAAPDSLLFFFHRTIYIFYFTHTPPQPLIHYAIPISLLLRNEHLNTKYSYHSL